MTSRCSEGQRLRHGCVVRVQLRREALVPMRVSSVIRVTNVVIAVMLIQ
jgi:hypothetical protein